MENVLEKIKQKRLAKLTPEQRAQAEKRIRIAEIERALRSMDYMTSKYADGEYTEAQWHEIIRKRRELRAELRRLESEENQG